MSAKKQKLNLDSPAESGNHSQSLDALDLMKSIGSSRLRLLKGRELRQCGSCRSVSLASLKTCPTCGTKHASQV